MTTTPETCDNCDTTKAAYNTETNEKVCNNRSCSESPMNEELTYM